VYIYYNNINNNNDNKNDNIIIITINNNNIIIHYKIQKTRQLQITLCQHCAHPSPPSRLIPFSENAAAPE